ncbi:NAD(P)/FAD-dependent oxidoreductase [Candidimonas nitroreducens]|uniref:Proton-conducting membrane transporter n=1 Tax=Candidimonas nitroreducens TaxID=683354 RepID=A0A225MUH8_9BURK|nr:FAD-dependent oxidoreductase [Candidimonas nitroreducens]OWT64123.1 proton-conducting membrane transporter [Candidimonas nitroreducens]
MQRILVLGAGFAGLWSALGAARELDELGAAGRAEVMVVNATGYHSIRVRNYEADLDVTRVPLGEVLDPAGVRWVVGTVQDIDTGARAVEVDEQGARRKLQYDRLVLALGSRLVHPPIPGLARCAFDVDTYAGARRLEQHLAGLAQRADAPGNWTVLVVGAGLTGIELACELPGRLRKIAGAAHAGQVRVLLADRSPVIAQAMGGAQPVIAQALADLGVETLPGVSVLEADEHGARLTDGTRIEAATLVWCGGMRAHPLMEKIPAPRDALGRVPVDEFLRVQGVPGVYAAGDCARALVDGTHESVMSCQYGRPMGRYAGHNVAAELMGAPLLPMYIDWYTTILDLGPWGAVYTEGRDRKLADQGASAKRTKRLINGQRIYPPRSGKRADLYAAAAPVVQAPPPMLAGTGAAARAC